MALPRLPPTATVLFTGDSITAGNTPAPPWMSDALATIAAAFAPQVLTTINTGIGGNTIAPNPGNPGTSLSENIATRITNYKPTHLVLEGGVNDAIVVGTSPSTFRTAYDSVLDAVIAAGTHANQIWCLEILCWGEAWHLVGGVPAWNNGVNDSQIDGLNVQIRASCAAHGCNLVTIRAPALALAVINNPTGTLTNGVLTLATGSPNPHPNVGLGIPFMSSQWLDTVDVTTVTELSTHPTTRINYTGQRIWSVGDAILLGTADGVSETGGCGWRGLLDIALRASGMTPQWVGTSTGGYLCATCPDNLRAMPYDGGGDLDCSHIQALLPTAFAAIGGFDVMLLEAGTKDLENDQINHTTLAQGAFTSLLAACVALRPAARFFVSNLPPSPGLNTGSFGPAFAAHVASLVASYVAGGTKMYLVDHFNGIPPQGSNRVLDQTVGEGKDFFDTVVPSGPGGTVQPIQYQGFPKMAEITYLTMTWAVP